MIKIEPNNKLIYDTKLINDKQKLDEEYRKIKGNCWYLSCALPDYFGNCDSVKYHCKYLCASDLTCGADSKNRKCVDLMEYETREIENLRWRFLRPPVITIEKITVKKDCQYAQYVRVRR